jgi:hypothetical protein
MIDQLLPIVRLVAGGGLLLVAYEAWLRRDFREVALALSVALLATK